MATRQLLDDQAQQIIHRMLTDGTEDPYPHYKWLREHAPVCYNPRFDAYLLSRYADCDRVLKDHATFRGPDRRTLTELFPQAAKHQSYRILLSSLPAMNPPQHTRMRRLLSRDFTPRMVERLRPDVTKLCDELLSTVAEQLRDGAVLDLHRAVSVPIPMQVAAQLLGIPRENLDQVAALVPHMVHVVNQAATEEQLDAADRAFGEFSVFLGDLVVRRRQDPRDDLISALVSVHDEDDDRLSAIELITMLQMLWAAGFETVAIAIDNAVLTWLRDKETHGEWFRDPKATPAWVDELLRWDTPGSISTGRRHATAAVDFGGYEVPAGASVRLLLNAANRDPDVYPDPDTFRPTRSGPASLAFGGGIHFCMGARLTRLEMSTLLHRVEHWMPGLALAGEPVRRRSIPLRDFESVPVRWGDG